MKVGKSVGGARGRLLAGVACCVLAGAWASGPRAADECGKLASVQNDVETKPAAVGDWAPSILNQVLFELDRVRTGAASRAAILYSDQTLHRINEKSEVEVVAPQSGNPGVVRVISGQHYFSARKPKDYGRIETPTVTAAIRGTEFVVAVGAGGTTTITMIEGIVDASNSFGSIQVGAGEAAFVEPGKAPVKQIVVRPRDAVSWSLYYPTVLGGADARRLSEMGAEGESLSRAAALLSAGQVDQAAPLIDQARQRNPKDPIALALASVIDVAADRKQEAMSLASEAVAADPNSAAAALAMSFASQAGLDLAQATQMAETAARLDPDSSEALARVAELRMAAGDTRGAKDAAERAVRRDPNSVRALTVLGFVQLAELRSDDAVVTFESAVQTDPNFPLAHLGLGIARIRRGDLTRGREEMQTAVILDPDNSLYRSYLSKAYYEEKREDAASKELAEAKKLDPSDPTPYLYDAMQKQVYNRPVEALKDIQTSIALNDRRAVYRSRLLLDQDLAVRSADLASIYNELGFEQLGMVAARSSADMDQSNYSAHNFLAGNYRGLPGFAPAFLSEALQARIYQPVNVNAVRPDIVNESVSFNEYTSLIDRPRLRGFAGYTYGDTDTDLSELYDPGDICVLPDGSTGPCQDVVEVGNSNPYGGDVTLSFNRDRFAGALAYRDYQSDGFRVNNDVATDALRGFFVFAPTYRDQIQVNFIDGHRESGDLPLRDFPAVVGLERIETDLTNIALGYHRIISPAADLAISAIYSDTTQDFSIPLFGLSSSAQLKGPQIEAQYVLKQARVSWIAGGGYFDGEQDVTSAIVGLPSASETGNDTFANAYVYAKLPSLGPVEITAGVSYEDLLAPIGLLPPRDSLMIVGDVEYEDNQLSPKFGLTAHATPKTVVRATAYTRLSPAVSRLQTLEPTQVAGFNQFFDDPAGTSSFNYGVGLDQEFTPSFFAGLSLLRRDLDIPQPTCATPNPGSWCSLQPAIGVEQRTSDDWLGGVYLNGTAGKRVALGLQYAYEERDFDFIQISNNSLFEDYVETQRVRPEVRLFLPMGFFALVRGTYYDQQVDQLDDLTSAARSTIESEFTIGDFQVGYRLPKRWGTVALSAYNFSDREFEFYRSSLEEDVVPARTIALTVNFASP